MKHLHYFNYYNLGGNMYVLRLQLVISTSIRLLSVCSSAHVRNFTSWQQTQVKKINNHPRLLRTHSMPSPANLSNHCNLVLCLVTTILPPYPPSRPLLRPCRDSVSIVNGHCCWMRTSAPLSTSQLPALADGWAWPRYQLVPDTKSESGVTK